MGHSTLSHIHSPVSLDIEPLGGASSNTTFELVQDFHDKFGIERPETPQMIDEETFKFRVGFMEEELQEYREAYANGNVAGCFDALVDLKYVVDGTADMHGFPIDAGTDEVHRANMRKTRAGSADESKRGSALDVVKPAGWEAPDMRGVLERSGCKAVTIQEYVDAIVAHMTLGSDDEDSMRDALDVNEDVKIAFRNNVPPKYVANHVL